MTQKEIIKSYLTDLGTFKREYEIRCLPTPYGFIGARGDRDVRDMIKSKVLEASFDGKYRIVRVKAQNIGRSYNGNMLGSPRDVGSSPTSPATLKPQISNYCCGDRLRGLLNHSKDCRVKEVKPELIKTLF